MGIFGKLLNMSFVPPHSLRQLAALLQVERLD